MSLDILDRLRRLFAEYDEAKCELEDPARVSAAINKEREMRVFLIEDEIHATMDMFKLLLLEYRRRR